MNALHSCALVDLSISISWEKDAITHEDHFYVNGLNGYRDIFPGSPLARLFTKDRPSDLSLDIQPGEFVPGFAPQKIMSLPWSRINHPPTDQIQRGRFYPRGILSGIPGIFKGNTQPFRCVDLDSKGILADMNHPMAPLGFTLKFQIMNRSSKAEERGGACMDWLEAALSGPGMQSRCNGCPTDFFTPWAFDRDDSGPDADFYRTDRFVGHVDTTAGRNLSGLYKSLLHPGETVLDLMAGWQSHIPEDLELEMLHGIGLNKNELKDNPGLSGFTLQDLNQNPTLEFKDHFFDAVICSLSVEYLSNPIPVFKEVARVLKPGGLFAVSFSNRWFEPKAINIWKDLHDFERMGMILEYFDRAGGFESFSTRSMRGYPRPVDDKYFPEIRTSDPVYVVAGYTVS